MQRLRRCRSSFDCAKEYTDYLITHEAHLPKGFQIGVTSFPFKPVEAPHLPANMTMTLIVPDEPTPLFTAAFTQNAFTGAPVKIGKQIVQDSSALLGAILVNNKISNVCARGGGVQDALDICQATRDILKLPKNVSVLPSSTGVIGWRLPVSEMISQLPELAADLQPESIFPAAKGIMTTDLYPKVRSLDSCGGRIVGIAKGAGMIEPNMATMLSFVLTDLAVPRNVLEQLMRPVVRDSFNSISVDTDESTSDTFVIVSSGKIPYDESKRDEFEQDLRSVCGNLAQDIVRNGEGTNHLIHVDVSNAPDDECARGVGKAVVNSPLFKCAVAGNDPNVGRLVMAIGKYLGPSFDISNCTIQMGGVTIYQDGEFQLNPEIEKTLIQHMKDAELRQTDYPPHEKAVQVAIDLGLNGKGRAKITGVDLTHEYVSINADYRS